MNMIAHTIHLPEDTVLGEALMIIPGDITEFAELHRAASDLAGELDAFGSERARAAMAAIVQMLGRGRLVSLRQEQGRRFDA